MASVILTPEVAVQEVKVIHFGSNVLNWVDSDFELYELHSVVARLEELSVGVAGDEVVDGVDKAVMFAIVKRSAAG